jgi:DNA-directed RNA polymerase specialized sigma24 family protein
MGNYQDESNLFLALREPVSFDEIQADGRPLSATLADPAPGADVRLEAKQRSQAIRRFVESLPPREREIVLDIFWRGRTQADLARERSVSRMSLCKAMKKISKLGKAQLAAHTDFARA